MNEWEKVNSFLTGHHDIVILVHDKPDGDCLGSAFALALGLAELGYRPVVKLPEKMPEIYHFLPGRQYLEITDDDILRANLPVITVDCTDTERLNYRINDSNPVLNIDHHISNDFFGQINIVDITAAATGEIIYELLSSAGVEISPDIATCLYVAISTDTGSFVYSNTTAKTLRIASELLARKTDLALIRQELHEKRPLEELLIIKAALEKLLILEEGQIIVCGLSYDELSRQGLLATETDNLLGLLRSTEGVEVALLLKELEPNLIKVSLRSKTHLDVNLLAHEFNGGGHERAAGCTINGNLSEVQELVLRKTRESLKQTKQTKELSANERLH